MGTELEIKLHLKEEAELRRVLAWPVLDTLREGAPYEIRMRTSYYDTPDGDFGRLRWTVRRRFENGRSIICVKTPKPAAGTEQTSPNELARGEWEVEAPSLGAGIPLLIADGAPAELAAYAELDPVELCGAEFLRRAQLLRLADGTLFELAADAGTLFRGEKRLPFCVLELELKAGSADAMLEFGAALQAQFGLREEKQSKFARARSL